MVPFLRFWGLRGSECVFGQWRDKKDRSERGQMRILEKSVRVVRSGVWLAAAACALVVGWQAAEESHGVVVGSMDPAVKPGDDFFRYSNGAWLARTDNPADRPSLT